MIDTLRANKETIAATTIVGATALVLFGIGAHNNATETPEHPETIVGWDLLTPDTISPNRLAEQVCATAAEIAGGDTDVVPSCFDAANNLGTISESSTVVVEVDKDMHVRAFELGSTPDDEK